MNDIYSKAFTEVLEILKYFPEDEYNRIPKDIIELYEKNKDINYSFEIDSNLELHQQKISKETKAILVIIFRDYFATEEEKNKLKEYYRLKEIKMELEKKQVFKDKKIFNSFKQKQDIDTNIPNVYKETFFTKFKKFVLKIFHI